MGSASSGENRPTEDTDKPSGGRGSAYLSAAIVGAILVGTIVVVRLSLTGPEPADSAATPVEQNTSASEAGGESSIDKLAEAVELAKRTSPRPRCGKSIGRGRVTGVISGNRIRVADSDCTVIVEYAGVRGFPSSIHGELAATGNAALVSGADVRLEYADNSEFADSVFFSDVFVGDELISETLVGLGLLDVDLEHSVSLYSERLERAKGEARRLRRGAWRESAAATDSKISSSTDQDNDVETDTIQIIAINPLAEVVTVSNTTDEIRNLSGWSLVAVEAEKSYLFPDETTLDPGESLQIVSGTSGAPPSRLFWTSEKIWNDDQSDTAQILDARGQVISSYPR